MARSRIGSQSDPVFLENVVLEMGGIDIVTDDVPPTDDKVNQILSNVPKPSPFIRLIGAPIRFDL